MAAAPTACRMCRVQRAKGMSALEDQLRKDKINWEAFYDLYKKLAAGTRLQVLPYLPRVSPPFLFRSRAAGVSRLLLWMQR